MTKMTKKKHELLEVIEQYDVLSIYQLASLVGRNYRRVYDHVQEFADTGLVQLKEEVRSGRKCMLVESTYHQRLNRLNDMYAFQTGLKSL